MDGNVCGYVVFPSLDNCSSLNMSLLKVNVGATGSDASKLAQNKIIGLYVMGSLCVFGIVGNVLSLLGLHHDKERREASFLLQCLAVIDGLYLFTAFFRYPLKHLVDAPTYEYIQLGAFPMLKSFQTICIWTMVLVTIDRYIHVCFPLRAQILLTKRSKRLWVITILVASFIYNLPRFFDSCISHFVLPCTEIDIVGMVFRPQFKHKAYSFIYRQVLYILLLYVAPQAILIFMNCNLIRAIRRSRKRHASHQDSSNDSNSTVVLVIIVIVFIVCEAPEPVIHSISAVEYAFHIEVFTFDFIALYTISDLLMLVNSSINFFIYVIFGRRFRETLKGMFRENFTSATSRFNRSSFADPTKATRQSYPRVHFTPQPAFDGVKV
ncbi:hypothetical protein CAPTEDRAFT_215484 [Capitella teleta]|uniref:G-protein coupled receptors family 1 profile domain-containing protein n=1 Tax=Capitella teleta TaxID=283909 RepID=R7TZE9_CAPTE|nr:hypothetical protein CAPTEDRAFT_215484 [Capitella teleta]|eukprot:ELT99149.1 hypothetical protein CAPTEDRAFT_215484 [Capitella teleta]